MTTQKMARLIKRTGIKLSNVAPEILVIGGIAGLISSGIMAYRKHKKAEDVKENMEGALVDIENAEGDEKELNARNRSVYISAAKEYAKIFAIPASIAVLSVGAILYSHKMIRKRLASMTAACIAAVDTLNRYRNNVRNEYGQRVDTNMMYGLIEEPVKEKEVDEETGKTKTVTKMVRKDGSVKMISPDDAAFTKLFCEGCKGWTKEPHTNIMILRAQQSFCNQRLKDNGYLFLNDVFDLLGIPQTKAGSELGWLYDPKGDGEGDGFVDFGIYDPYFEAGLERNVWLNFNVDGPIRDKIKWASKV